MKNFDGIYKLYFMLRKMFLKVCVCPKVEAAQPVKSSSSLSAGEITKNNMWQVNIHESTVFKTCCQSFVVGIRLKTATMLDAGVHKCSAGEGLLSGQHRFTGH